MGWDLDNYLPKKKGELKDSKNKVKKQIEIPKEVLLNNFVEPEKEEKKNGKPMFPRIREIITLSEMKCNERPANEAVALFKEHLLLHLEKDKNLYKAQRGKAKKQLARYGTNFQDFFVSNISLNVTTSFIKFIEKLEVN